MSASFAIKKLAGQIALLSSEYRKLQKRCGELEELNSRLTQQIDYMEESGEEAIFLDGDRQTPGSIFDRERAKAKLESILAELTDIG